jgi:hypothetical protein
VGETDHSDGVKEDDYFCQKKRVETGLAISAASSTTNMYFADVAIG